MVKNRPENWYLMSPAQRRAWLQKIKDEKLRKAEELKKYQLKLPYI